MNSKLWDLGKMSNKPNKINNKNNISDRSITPP